MSASPNAVAEAFCGTLVSGFAQGPAGLAALGSLYGEANPRSDIPRLLSLYREGKLLLDETVTHEYKLNDINSGYDDMLAGNIIRGVIIHDH